MRRPTILIPFFFGAGFIASFFSDYHVIVFSAGSMLMIVVGLLSLFRKSIRMPFVSKLRAPQVTDAASAYVLGLVSGMSSTCCAPVLLGALSLAALSPNILQAAAVGLAYTFGIVFPLFILSVFFSKGLERWMLGLRQKTVKIGGISTPLSNFISFVIFTGSGILFLMLALSNRLQMTDQAIEISITLKAWVDKITQPLLAIPYSQFLFGIILAGILVYFIRLSLKESRKKDDEQVPPQ